MSKNWKEVQIAATPLLNYLSRSTFFDRPYAGNSRANRVIFDIAEATARSTDDSGERFEDWQNLLESVTPAWPEMPREIEGKILEILDQMTTKHYCSALNDTLINNMQGDIARLIHCHAFGDVHELWRAVQQAYLDGGLPCGWEGRYPDGRLVVFST
ncbi:hypothetical protein [Duganella sp. CF458]|uniref:hypothetical protein n=1 Tax=Duganella sp. CF458 TaxID=1884368 RepID=UPI000B81C5D2|nr:hypothetical protein [Duganella sp. CF458]